VRARAAAKIWATDIRSDWGREGGAESVEGGKLRDRQLSLAESIVTASLKPICFTCMRRSIVLKFLPQEKQRARLVR
jgi:hypothetical protein